MNDDSFHSKVVKVPTRIEAIAPSFVAPFQKEQQQDLGNSCPIYCVSVESSLKNPADFANPKETA